MQTIIALINRNWPLLLAALLTVLVIIAYNGASCLKSIIAS